MTSDCEICPAKQVETVKFMSMTMCMDCYQNELNAQNQLKSTADARVSEMNRSLENKHQVINDYAKLNITINKAEEIDAAITRRTDIFNAETVSINELCLAIDKDDNIVNKPYVKAETLLKRFNHFKKVIFDKQQEIVDESNKAQAVQTYLNTLANTLRTEERERLRLSDINYQPSKESPKSTRISVKKDKFDKTELIRTCQQLSEQLGFTVEESLIRTICVARNCSIQVAAQSFVDSVNGKK